MSAGTVVLVGCGQMGSAMLHGWLRRDAASRFVVIEPAGAPEMLALERQEARHIIAIGAQRIGAGAPLMAQRCEPELLEIVRRTPHRQIRS